ncbi:TetR/AcrR family transcriptional regulator [Paenibacillus pinihumi]|uniref:TetR/AcrR family transcriptional regulator n=1 Tax=Paenibacillus pinihumi TaxID=669462 RepID=UPI0004296E91|nr:TetR/AcrR family transcriptional regulator [Paenibacillus pinihumi]
MAPKPKFTKQQIIDAAFDIAVETGIGSITIRKVAERLGSSIAPIYVNFNEVEELISEVIRRIADLSREMLDQQQSGEPFRDIGLASLRFARAYSTIFKEMLLGGNQYMESYNQEMGSMLITQMREDQALAGFSDDELGQILLKMRIFQTGLSVMLSSDLLPPSIQEEQAIALLDSVAEDVIRSARIRQQETSVSSHDSPGST